VIGKKYDSAVNKSG